MGFRVFHCTFLLLYFLLCFKGECGQFRRVSRVIDIELNYSVNDRWTTIAKTDSAALKELINILRRSRAGKKIWQRAQRKARRQGQNLIDVLQAGDGSLTDTTLVRKFYPSDPEKVQYESHSKVFINRRISVKDAVLDIAHELVHYSDRAIFNPYQRDFTLKEFIVSTVEGKGGEVEAYLMECGVLHELFPRYSGSNCEKVIDRVTGNFSKQKGVKLFYQLGKHLRPFLKTLFQFDQSVDELPYLNSAEALFISSAYGLPYPLAAMKEYLTIMDKACENDKRRLDLMKYRIERRPSSTLTNKSRNDLITNMTRSYKTRCQKFF